MKLNLNLHEARWFVLVIIGVASCVIAYIDQTILPLLVAVFALIFIATPLVKDIRHAHRVFLGRLGLATLLVMFGVGAFNYVINPFGLYPTHVFEPIVLTSRDYKMKLYAAYSPPPQALILGSSRSFTVDPTQIEHLWGYSTFNASVAVGSIADALGFLRYTSQVGKLPDLLIINVAPETLPWNENIRFTQEPNARLWNYIDNKSSLLSLKDGYYRMTRLLSKEQLEASVRVLWAKSTDKLTLFTYNIGDNGMVHVAEAKLSPDDLNPDKIFYSLDVNHLYFGTMFTTYQPHIFRLDVLQQILELAKQKHMVVIGYMPPYHPVLRDILETRTQFTPNVNYITSQLDIFEKDYPFHYINFIDSELFSNGDGLFDDILHPNAQASALMMQQLYNQFHRYVEPS